MSRPRDAVRARVRSSSPRRVLRAAFVVAATLGAAAAHAEPPPAPAASAAPRASAQGVAVLGADASRDHAFTVARAIYASPLRPAALDEARARVLAGDPPPEGASTDLRELSELRAGVTGGDAASRRLLATIAEQLGVRAVLVVQVDAPHAADAGEPSARLFLADAGELDAARYAPEPGVVGPNAWRATVASLERRFAAAPAPAPARAAATSPAPTAPRPPEEGPRPFYASAWFWAAVGGAALVGGAIWFASRDTTPDSIHLQMRVPK